MKPGDIVYLGLTHRSFSWNNGLKIVVAIDEDSVRLCSIDEKGKPDKYDDGRYMCSVTSANNTEIYPTSMTFQLEKGLTYL